MAGTLLDSIDWAWRTFFRRGARSSAAAATPLSPPRRGDSPAARPPPPSRRGEARGSASGSAAVPDPLADALRRWDLSSAASLSHSPPAQPPLSAEDVRRRVLGATLSLWELPLEVRESGSAGGGAEDEDEEAGERGGGFGHVAESKALCFTPIRDFGAASGCDRSLTRTVSLQHAQQQENENEEELSHLYNRQCHSDWRPPVSREMMREEEAWKLAVRIREVSAILLRNTTNKSGTDDTDIDDDEENAEDEEAAISYDGGHLLYGSNASVDRRVRTVYDALVSRLCHHVVSTATSHCFARLHGAATRAMDRWLLSRVHAIVAEATAPYGAFPPRGIARHVRGGFPATLSTLRPDTEDERRAEGIFCASRGGPTLQLQGGLTLTHAELATLHTGAWLSDQVINAYLSLLCSTAGGAEAVSLGTHFFARVEQDMSFSAACALQPLSTGSGALRWLRRRQHILHSGGGTRVVLVPVNLSQNHWTLAVLDWERRAWLYYDSNITGSAAVARGRRILTQLAHVFEEARRLLGTRANATHNGDAAGRNECESKRETRAMKCRLVVAVPLEEEEEEEEANESSNEMQSRGAESRLGGVALAPQQRNSYDCGVFVCYAAWCAVQGVALDFTQADVTAMRRVMLHELMCQRILERFPVSAFTKGTDLHV